MELNISEQHTTYAIKIDYTQNNDIVGWAFLVIIQNDRHTEPYGLLENMYIEEQHRGKKIGTSLLSAIIDEAKKRGCYKLLATSRYSKPEVHAWYEKAGFVDWGKEFRMDLINSQPLQND